MFISCNQKQSTVTVLDDDLRLAARIEVPQQPHMVVRDPATDLLYVAITYRDGYYDVHAEHGHEIVVIDPDGWKITEVVDIAPYAGPHDLAVLEDRLLVVCESHGGCLLSIDLKTHELLGHVPTETGGPHWLAVHPNGKKAYTGNKEAEFLSVLDLGAQRMAGRIEMPTGSEDLDLSADGAVLYAADRNRPLLHLVDTETELVLGQVELPHPPHRTHVLSDGLVVTAHSRQESWSFDSTHAGSVSVVDPIDRRVLREIPVAPGPLGITSVGDRLYVNCATGWLTVIDCTTWQPVDTVPMDLGAHELIYLER